MSCFLSSFWNVSCFGFSRVILIYFNTRRWGCIFLLVGQLDLHSEVLHTLHYVVNQSDNTAQILRNVSDYLSIAKAVDVPQFNLPQSTMKEIDDLSSRLSSGAETLTDKTNENSVKVLELFSTVYKLSFLVLVHFISSLA